MNKKLIIIIAVTAAAAVLVLAPTLTASAGSSGAIQGRPQGGSPPAGGRTSPGGKSENREISVRAEAAARRTLQTYMEVNGEIIAAGQVSVMPDAAGKLVSLRTTVGASVRKGEVLAEVDPSKPGTTYSLSPVYAPISGTVTALPVYLGASVSNATAIAVVSDGSKLEVEAMINERDVGQLRVGLRAAVSLEAYPLMVFPAEVSIVSPVVDPVSRAKKIVLRFIQRDERINAGMFAKIKLDTLRYEDRICVPSEAVLDMEGSRYVYVVGSDNTVSRKEVILGASADGYTEIAAGLAAGETVVIAGFQMLSEGAKVRIVAPGSAS